MVRLRKFWAVGLATLSLLVSVAPTFAQTATPTPPPVSTPVLNTAAILSGAGDMVGQYGLLALVLVGAFIGVAALLISRLRRAAG